MYLLRKANKYLKLKEGVVIIKSKKTKLIYIFEAASHVTCFRAKIFYLPHLNNTIVLLTELHEMNLSRHRLLRDCVCSHIFEAADMLVT